MMRITIECAATRHLYTDDPMPVTISISWVLSDSDDFGTVMANVRAYAALMGCENYTIIISEENDKP